MNCILLKAGVLAGAALASTTASADITAEATVSELTFTLVDLAPNDGIAPTISWSPFANSSANIDTTTLWNGQHIVQTQLGAPPTGPVAVSSDSGGGNYSRASVTGDAFAGTGVLHAEAGSGAAPMSSDGRTWAGVNSTGMPPAFTLSPNTELLVSGNASVSSVRPVAGYDILASGQVYAAISDLSGVPRTNYSLTSYNGNGRLDQASFMLSFENTDSTYPLDGNLSIVAEADAVDRSIPAVPEPGAAGLMLAGLGLVGLWGRRRRDPPRGVLKAALLAAAAMGGSVASATTTAQATVTDYTFTLVDLAPNDGVTPWITWAPEAASMARLVSLLPDGSEISASANGAAPAGAVSVANDSGNGTQASASISGDAFAGGALLQASAGSGDSTGYTLSSAQALVGGDVSPRFTLSANTELRISGLASVLTFSSDPGNSQANADVRAWVAGEMGGQSDNFQLNSSGYDGHAIQANFSLSFANESTVAIGGQLQSEVGVGTSHGLVSLVPEPGGGALMLAGLGLAGVVARRRRALQ